MTVKSLKSPKASAESSLVTLAEPAQSCPGKSLPCAGSAVTAGLPPAHGSPTALWEPRVPSQHQRGSRHSARLAAASQHHLLVRLAAVLSHGPRVPLTTQAAAAGANQSQRVSNPCLLPGQGRIGLHTAAPKEGSCTARIPGTALV